MNWVNPQNPLSITDFFIRSFKLNSEGKKQEVKIKSTYMIVGIARRPKSDVSALI